MTDQPTSTFDPTKFNPFDPAFLADPYPTYSSFREQAPVATVNLTPDGKNSAYWVFLDQDVRTVLNETEVFVKAGRTVGSPVSLPFGVLGVMPSGLFSSNPPEHTELRSTIEPLFMKAIANASTVAASVIDAQMQTVSATRRFELIQDFALPVPAGVLYNIHGFAGAGMVLTGWITAIVGAHNAMSPIGVKAQGGTCAMALRSFFEGLIAVNAEQPVGGLFGMMCDAVGHGLTAEDVEASMADMTVAGYISTTFLIGSGIRALLNNPDQVQALRDDPTLMPAAIEEMMRFDAPAQLVDRVVTQPITLSGVQLKPGDKISAVLGSANRDPAVYKNPDQFDIRRADPSQVAFGGGIHYCIGAPLARITTPAAISALMTLDDLRLNGTPQWQTDPYLRGLTSLPVAWGQ